MKQFFEVFKRGSKTFYFAGLFLPKKYRSKVAKLYYYCRIPDDICDTLNKSTTDKSTEIDSFLSDKEVTAFLVENNIPIEIYRDLINGIKSDLNFDQPKTLEELIEYSYKVAGTVGIMMSYIFGVRDPKALSHAKSLGIAMQITNILRDIDEDLEKGRIYIPLDLMQKHKVTNLQIREKGFDQNLLNLIKELTEIAKEYYTDGNNGISYLPKNVRHSIKLASRLYAEILIKIEKNNYNPFLGRVYLSLFEKATKLIYA